MRLDELKRSYPAINSAASALLSFLGPAFTGTPAGHIETDIAAAASAAGSAVLRGAVPNLGDFPTGAPVLAELHHDQAHLLTFMSAVLPSLGLSETLPRDRPEATEHGPLLSLTELVGKLQGPLQRVTADANLAPEFQGYVAIYVAMKLVAAGHSMGVLDQEAGKGLAVYYLAAGSHTVPPPFDERRE